MSGLDLDQWLQEVSSASPCGDDLEYDGEFLEMTRAAAGKPAQEIGGHVIAGEEPDWRDVRERCVALLRRTKDLRIAVFLARALARTDGLAGFAAGLGLLRGLVERYWDGVHPRLDPDDHDPVFRMNTIAGLADRDQVVTALRTLPLANSRRVGRFGLRDIEIANGTLPRPEGADHIADLATVDAAFLDMEGAELESTAQAAQAALEQATALDASLGSAVGSGSSADLALLLGTLRSIQHVIQQQRTRRGLGSDATGETTSTAVAGGTPGGSSSMSGPLQSREDVIRVLDQVCDWYSKFEPSSPVPLLLQRAKRLVNKNFVEAIQDLTPSGVTEIQNIAGLGSGS